MLGVNIVTSVDAIKRTSEGLALKRALGADDGRTLLVGSVLGATDGLALWLGFTDRKSVV